MSQTELRSLLLSGTTDTKRNSSTTTFDESIKKNMYRRVEQRSYSITRKTINRFRSKIFLLDTQEMCLCGLLSITHSVHLVSCIEIFFALILLMQSPDLLTMDGTYFYFLGFFDHAGGLFFFAHVFLCTFCLISCALLFMSARWKSSRLIIPHILWQITFIIFSFSTVVVLMLLGFRGKMLLPSSVVISLMMITAGSCEVWWLFLSIAYYRHIESQLDNSFSSSQWDDYFFARGSIV